MPEWVLYVITALVAFLGGTGGKWVLEAVKQHRDGRLQDEAEEFRRDSLAKGAEFRRQTQIINRLEQQLAVVQAEQSRTIVGERRCREEVVELRTTLRFLWGIAQEQQQAMERAGLQVGRLPEMPDFHLQYSVEAEADFARRQTEHGTGLVRDEARRAQGVPPGAPPGQSPGTESPRDPPG
jgi:hypothetical protein